jgi:hypothetical protein
MPRLVIRSCTKVFVALDAPGDSLTTGAVCAECCGTFATDAAIEAAVIDSLQRQPGMPELVRRGLH